MSAKDKDCSYHGKRRRIFFRRVIGCILTFLLLVLIVIFLIWAILRPSKPSFILRDTTLYVFNASIPNFVTSSFQVTIASRNPNDRIGIFYDRLDVYASYRNQQITLMTALPPTYQDHNENNVWSPFIYGNMCPVAPDNFEYLGEEQSAGTVFLTIRIDGRVRFKVGTFVSKRYHLFVRCPAFLTFGSQNNGIIVGANAIKFQFVTRCSVSL
ncbi:hypothetical protein PTKIN_Ptkin06aG0069000 [Pterospermum kingtungense]